MMRIITGTARGTKLETLEGENTRPTAERTKMAIFNILQFDIEGRRILDLFGGSGQMALEALSRGALSAYVCDAEQEAFNVIKKNAQKTKLFDKVRLVCTDYKTALRNLSGKERFHIIFLDPPYNSNYIEVALKLICQGDLLEEGGFIVCESDRPCTFSNESLSIYKSSKYGKAHITIFQKNTNGGII